MEFTYALRFEFTATNNEAEYEALIAGLRIAARMGVRNLEANVDSRLVANHVLGEYVAKEDNMIQYLDRPVLIRALKIHISSPREQIHLGDGDIYGDRRAGSYVDDPYHRIHYVLREIHAGSCSMHSGPRSVVARALRSGYYWPTMHRDARDMIRKCHDCQDYFTTWIEARAVATSREYGVNDLFGTTIVCRFGLLETIVWTMGNISCDTRSKGWWVEEIVHVHVGRNCTNNQRCQGDTPVLSCLYGTEAVIPAEIGMPTIRTAEHLQLSSYPEVTILSSTSRTLRKPLWRGLSEIPSNGNSPLKCKRTLGYHATGKDRHCSCATSVLVRSKSGWPPQRSEASSQG
ncbi:reverse transcriptase domain-containing protein [Tanacetum coccineum]